MKRYSGIVAGLISSIAMQSTVADQDRQDQALETIVVTENYAPSRVSATAASITVLDFDALNELNKSQLSDALRTLPGVLIEEQGGAGGLVALSIRGGEGNFTKILLNGVALNDPTNVRGGSYDMNLLNDLEVDRIEVVKGPQSVIHGSDALAGVIHLVTPAPSAAIRPKVSLEGGHDGYYNMKLSTGADLGPVGVFVNAGTRDSGEWVAGSERQVDFVNAMATLSIGESDNLTAQLHWLKGNRTSYPEQGGGPELSVSPALERSDYESELVALTWARDWSARFRTDLKFNTLRYQEQTDSPGIVPYTSVPANGTDAVFKQQTISWINTAELGNDHSLSFGADYRDERGDSKGYLDFGFLIPTDYRLSRETTGVFLQWRSRFNDALDLNMSTRYDDTDRGQHQHTSRLGFKYALTPVLALRANWGQGFKLPSFFALGHALVGNPELLPEEARGFDIGAEWQLSGASVVGLSWFENRYTNLIDFDPQAFTNINRDRVDTQGLELWGQWQGGENFSLDFALTKTNIEVVGSARELEGRPDWQATLGARWILNSDLTTRLDYRWVGEVFSSSLHTGQSNTQALDDQRQLDWRLTWAATANLSMNLAIDNVLDDNFETSVGFPNAGRTLRLGIQWKAD